GGKIARIGDLASATAPKIIDAEGLIVSPGFIDIHNHSDEELISEPRADTYIRQGVTTLFVGQCGGSAAPSEEYPTFGSYLDTLASKHMAPNVAALVGHGNIRRLVVGGDDRAPTPEELEKMKAMVAAAMDDGAYGLSTGLVYFPGMYAKTDEIIELAKVVAPRGGIYATHVRDDGARWLEAIQEAIEIARQSGAQLQIAHNESHYPNWGKIAPIMQAIHAARDEGIRVGVDVIPATAGGQGIGTAFPNWALEGGTEKLIARLKDPAQRARVVAYIKDKSQHTSPLPSLIADGYGDRIFIQGKSLADIAKERNQNLIDAAIDLVIERNGTYSVVQQSHFEDDIRLEVADPMLTIGSDGSIQKFGEGNPNPRSYSTFPLVFRKYVRGETRAEEPREVGKAILTMEEAVKKLTSQPAEILGLKDRGLLREGYWADITVFDPKTISDMATYANPHQYPVGIPYVIVNGELVIENSEHTGALPGAVLKGPGTAATK
ncbi:MAG: D-aminoacylase, partial [Gemmatimonadetes bacterium]|nr:D-aminoacylase [Gemmatimonadota bacterium]